METGKLGNPLFDPVRAASWCIYSSNNCVCESDSNCEEFGRIGGNELIASKIVYLIIVLTCKDSIEYNYFN